MNERFIGKIMTSFGLWLVPPSATHFFNATFFGEGFALGWLFAGALSGTVLMTGLDMTYKEK